MIQSVNKYHIYEILSADGNFYYTIPEYQREYTWSYREWEALYDDISENNDEYFIGSIICIPLVNPAKRNVLDLKNETCKNREKRNVLKISHTRYFKAIKKQSVLGCFYSF